MDFELNGDKWKINKKNAKEIVKEYRKNNIDDIKYLFGYADFVSHRIFINGDACFDQQCRTLAHELAHCYMFESGMYYIDKFNEELVCDLVSSCYKKVYEIVERYKKEMKGSDSSGK